MDNVQSPATLLEPLPTPQEQIGLLSWRNRFQYIRITILEWAIGIFCLLVGALMLIVPHQFSSPAFSGVGFLIYMSLVSIPNHGISGIVFYGGFGVLVILLPWLTRSHAWIDTASLQLRFGLLFAAAAIPVIGTITLISTQQEWMNLDQTITNQQILAESLARDTKDYIKLHHSAVIAFASQSELLEGTVEQRCAWIQTFSAQFSDFSDCAISDSGRQYITSSGNSVTQPLLESIHIIQQPVLHLHLHPLIARPILELSAPIRGQNGTIAGTAI